jgi:RNA polymerase sigma-70 factor (ECF subfamily)
MKGPRALYGYLYRVSSNAALADDLVQEAYYRLLRTRFTEINQDYMKNYLFRVATNLLRDHWRQARSESLSEAGESEPGLKSTRLVCDSAAETIHTQSDLQGVLQRMKPRERQLLWLAYAEGSSHREIADIVGLKEHSIRPLLFRARRKLASLLRGRGILPQSQPE